MAFTINDLHDLIRLLEEHPEWRAELRRVLLTEELLQLPDLVRDLAEAQRRTEQQLAELAEITRQNTQQLAHHSQQIAELVEVTRQHSQQLAQHSQVIAELTEITRQNTQQLAQHTQQLAHHSQMLAELVEVTRQHSQAIAELREAQQQTQRTVERLEQTTMQLVDWQRGEAGRRRGEQYEQRVIRRAASLFAGGEGGSPEKFSVHRRLARWIRPLYQDARVPSEDADPFLADLIWWKGDEVVVVEVSLKVDTNDVRRARQRTDTLREAGVRATPVVIGEEWAIPEVQALAQQEGVEWMVGGGLSQGFLQFRQLPSEEPSDEEPIEA
ncbi:MAG: hypothetical protein ABDI19_01440 [Armatimonadota bacterium]